MSDGTAPRPPNRAEADSLQQATANLVETVANLSPTVFSAVGDMRKTNRHNRWLMRLFLVGLILDVALSITLALVVVGQVHNANNVHALTNRLNVAQTTQRRQVLCPLYTLIISTETPQARAAAPDKALYDHTVKVIQDGYNALNCKQTGN